MLLVIVLAYVVSANYLHIFDLQYSRGIPVCGKRNFIKISSSFTDMSVCIFFNKSILFVLESSLF
jgi:hypothetical protein